MAYFHIKKKNNRPYLYVREMARVNGKPKVVWQKYLGPPERVKELVEQQGGQDVTFKVEEFGTLWAANLMDKDIDFAKIVGQIVRPDPHEKGPSVGEYFLYAILNRMVEAKSKRSLPGWYASTAVQTIRPVDTEALSSPCYWEKWDRVSQKDIDCGHR